MFYSTADIPTQSLFFKQRFNKAKTAFFLKQLLSELLIIYNTGPAKTSAISESPQFATKSKANY